MTTWSDEVGRTLSYNVKYVIVENDKAWFGAYCIYDSAGGAKEGDWLFVKVYDGGTPGWNGDKIGWDWNSIDEHHLLRRIKGQSDPNNWWDVIDGNLVVHT